MTFDDDAAPELPKVDVLGVHVRAADIPRVLDRLQRFIAEERRTYVCVPDVNLLMQCQEDAELLSILNGSGLTVTDGMPLVWMCRLKGHRNAKRVYGPDLLLAACADGLGRGRRHFFYGGAEGVADALAQKLAARFPGLQVAGTECPPFRPLTDAEAEEAAARINARRPDIVWVGLGAPKQEYWMRRFRPLLGAPVLVGVGAAFDFHSGAKPQAPAWMRGSGLEWTFRLATEPARLWPRYSKVVPGFLIGVALQAVGLRKTVVEDRAAGHGTA